jgi:vacuolar-type H+-ATPase subunit I/STV1
VKDVQMDVTAQVLHDWLIENRPDGADHPSDCAMCAETASTQEENVSAEATLTQEQHQQLLESAVEKVKAEAVAAADADVLHLNEQLAEAKSALAEKDEEIASLKATISEREEAERLEALANERVEQVKAVASFNDEQIATRREAWAKMDEGEFGAYLEDIKAVAAVKVTTDDKAPITAFDGTRETAGDGTEQSAIEQFFRTDLSAAAQF